MKKLFIALGFTALTACLHAADKWAGQDIYTSFATTSWGAGGATAVTNDNTVFLWNVGAGREGSDSPAFLNVGGHWGVEASLYHFGMPLHLYYVSRTLSEAKYRYNYHILTNANSNGNTPNKIGHIYASVGSGGNINLTEDGRGVMTDRRSKDFDDMRAYGYQSDWMFYDTGDKDNSYWICYKNGTKWYYLMRNPDRAEGRRNVVVCQSLTTPEARANAYCKWKVVSKQDLTDNFRVTPANYHDLADASFYIHDNSFARNNLLEDRWQKSGTGTIRFANARDKDTGETSTDGDVYRVGTRTTDTQYTSSPVGTMIPYNIPYGQFYNAEITGGTGKVSQQTEQLPISGYYIVTCQGFYRPGDGTTAQNACLYAKTSTATTPQAENWSVVRLPHIGSITPEPADLTESGRVFYESRENYSCHAIVWVNAGETLEIGVTLDQSTGSKDEWTAFDNFAIKYIGSDFLVAQNFGNPSLYPEDDLNFQTAVIRRSFVLGQWNSIVLPVTLNKDQVKTAFGTDVELAELTGLDSRGRDIAFRMVDLDRMAWTDEAMKVNHAYLIKVHKQPREFTKDWGAPVYATQEGPYYLAPGVSFRKSDLASNPHIMPSTSGQTITLHPTYYYMTSQPGSQTDQVRASETTHIYVMNRGALTRYTRDFNLLGLRWWLEYSEAPSAARVNIYTDQTATAIASLPADSRQADTTKPQGVYNLGGQRLRDTSGNERLPMGTYIIDGKKVIAY